MSNKVKPSENHQVIEAGLEIVRLKYIRMRDKLLTMEPTKEYSRSGLNALLSSASLHLGVLQALADTMCLTYEQREQIENITEHALATANIRTTLGVESTYGKEELGYMSRYYVRIPEQVIYEQAPATMDKRYIVENIVPLLESRYRYLIPTLQYRIREHKIL